MMVLHRALGLAVMGLGLLSLGRALFLLLAFRRFEKRKKAFDIAYDNTYIPTWNPTKGANSDG